MSSAENTFVLAHRKGDDEPMTDEETTAAIAQCHRHMHAAAELIGSAEVRFADGSNDDCNDNSSARTVHANSHWNRLVDALL